MGNSKHRDKPDVPDGGGERPVAEGDVLGNFVRRTDDGYRGVTDRSLIGEDVGDDPEDEDDARDPPPGRS
jgi:hypothetical protein